ncbi:hypothetical protein EDB89DRAFT_2058655 [Lactarius sanguifluus]|nr:hypothetical protein EDB89DRAFT_2058655 [Lactarius sanguifluus]
MPVHTRYKNEYVLELCAIVVLATFLLVIATIVLVLVAIVVTESMLPSRCWRWGQACCVGGGGVLCAVFGWHHVAACAQRAGVVVGLVYRIGGAIVVGLACHDDMVSGPGPTQRGDVGGLVRCEGQRRGARADVWWGSEIAE